MQKCPCESDLNYSECCEKYILGKSKPVTAELLMRARYSAYSKIEVDYLKKTLAPESRHDFDIAATKKWAELAVWKGLKILSTKNGLENDTKGVVEFVATYTAEGETLEHHEVSQFRKSDSGDWYFIDGDAHTHKEGESHQHYEKPQTVVREAPKIERNGPCVCGSGKKYKKCCGINN